jgi:hypothetical protein
MTAGIGLPLVIPAKAGIQPLCRWRHMSRTKARSTLSSSPRRRGSKDVAFEVLKATSALSDAEAFILATNNVALDSRFAGMTAARNRPAQPCRHLAKADPVTLP